MKGFAGNVSSSDSKALDLAPIVLFVYNRLWHTQQTVEALRKNALAAESELLIFCDGPKDDSQNRRVSQVREYVKAIDGFRKVTVIERGENLGLAASVISGVTEVVNAHGKIIVLEDDIETSPYFLTFMNEALKTYEENEEVMSVSGYMFPVEAELPETFLLHGGTASWGWATWKRAWSKFNPSAIDLLDRIAARESIRKFNYEGSYDFFGMLRENVEGKNDSWAIRWKASVFLAGGYGLWPGKSLVQNIGLDASGTHCGVTTKFTVRSLQDRVTIQKLPITENLEARQELVSFFRGLSEDMGIGQRARSALLTLAQKWFGGSGST